MMQQHPTPYVIFVDDDPGIAGSMSFLLKAEQIPFVSFSSGEEFLSALKLKPELLEGPGCILLDIRMNKLSGLDVFDTLKKSNCCMPIAFMTGHGDVQIVARVMQEGAFDFMPKPVAGEELVTRIKKYFEISLERWSQKSHKASVIERIDTLTGKEKIIMGLLFEGAANTEMADQLGNSVRTIELRRAAVYDKLQVANAVELVRLLDSIGWKNTSTQP